MRNQLYQIGSFRLNKEGRVEQEDFLDKFGRVYFAFVISKIAATCHEYIC